MPRLHEHTPTHTHTHTHTNTHIFLIWYALVTHTNTHTHTHSLTHTNTRTHTLAHTLSHTLTHTHLSLFKWVDSYLMGCFGCTNTHNYTHTNTYTHALSLFMWFASYLYVTLTPICNIKNATYMSYRGLGLYLYNTHSCQNSVLQIRVNSTRPSPLYYM